MQAPAIVLYRPPASDGRLSNSGNHAVLKDSETQHYQPQQQQQHRGFSDSPLIDGAPPPDFPDDDDEEEEEDAEGSRDSPYPDEFESGSLTSEGAKLSILARAKAVDEQVTTVKWR